MQNVFTFLFKANRNWVLIPELLSTVEIANKNLGNVVCPFEAAAASHAKYFCFHLAFV